MRIILINYSLLTLKCFKALSVSCVNTPLPNKSLQKTLYILFLTSTDYRSIFFINCMVEGIYCHIIATALWVKLLIRSYCFSRKFYKFLNAYICLSVALFYIYYNIAIYIYVLQRYLLAFGLYSSSNCVNCKLPSK